MQYTDRGGESANWSKSKLYRYRIASKLKVREASAYFH